MPSWRCGYIAHACSHHRTGGDINVKVTQWHKIKDDYIFNGYKLAAAFRADAKVDRAIGIVGASNA